MQVHASTPARGPRTAPGLWLGVKALAAMALARRLHWHDVARRRRALLALDAHMLKDIGISRAEAEREARQPFWRDGTDPERGRPVRST